MMASRVARFLSHPRFMIRRLSLSTMLLCFAPAAGCSVEGRIDVDASALPSRFHIHQKGWPAPFYIPRITEFAIASEEDGPIWQLEAESGKGVMARNLAIEYGILPTGFVQVYPEGDQKPTALRTGRTYFVAAGGPKAIYRMVFALPVESWRPISPTPAQKEPDDPSGDPVPTTLPTSQDVAP